MAKIAQAEGAEAGCRRARDLEGLRNAVTDKLTHQRNFVVWRDNRPKSNGGKPTPRSATTGKQGLCVVVDGVAQIKGSPPI